MLIAEYRNRRNETVQISKDGEKIRKVNTVSGHRILYSGYRGKEIYDLINRIIREDAPVSHLVYHGSYPFHYVPGEKMYYRGYETRPEYDRKSDIWMGNAVDSEGHSVWFACRSLEDFWNEFKSVVDDSEEKA